MTKVIFKIDFDSDLNNYSEIPKFRDPKRHSEGLPMILRQHINNKKRLKIESKKFLTGFYKKNKSFLIMHKQQCETAWRVIEKKYFERLENVTKRKICSSAFTATLTTIRVCPYSYENKSFMFSFMASPVANITTCAHEILHIQIINSYQSLLRKEFKKGSKIKWHLLEALTVLLNEEFKDILPFFDMGYPEHNELREVLKNEWRKNKDFETFLPKAIEITKQVMKN